MKKILFILAITATLALQAQTVKYIYNPTTGRLDAVAVYDTVSAAYDNITIDENGLQELRSKVFSYTTGTIATRAADNLDLTDSSKTYQINEKDILRASFNVLIRGGDSTGTNEIATLLKTTATGYKLFYFPRGRWKITGTWTIPTGALLVVDPGAVITGTGTLTGAHTSILAGNYQIFDTTLTFAGTWEVDKATPQWFGAIGDTTLANASRFGTYLQKAVDAFDHVVVPPGDYLLTKTVKISRKYTTLEASRGSEIYVKGNDTAFYITAQPVKFQGFNLRSVTRGRTAWFIVVNGIQGTDWIGGARYPTEISNISMYGKFYAYPNYDSITYTENGIKLTVSGTANLSYSGQVKNLYGQFLDHFIYLIGGTGVNKIDAWQFSDFTGDLVRHGIHIDSNAIGNTFTNYQLQPIPPDGRAVPLTSTMIYCSSRYNTFQGFIWDDAYTDTTYNFTGDGVGCTILANRYQPGATASKIHENYNNLWLLNGEWRMDYIDTNYTDRDVIIGKTTTASLKINGPTQSLQAITAPQLILPATTSSTAGVIYQSGQRFLHTYGTQNLFCGNQTGNFTLSGTANAAYGYQSLPYATTAANNAALGGYRPLFNLTKGSNNTALGSLALYYDTTGSDNFAAGYSALISLRSGSDNIAIGSNAASSLTTGSYAVAIGSGALQNATASGICIGYHAGQGITTGANNTFIGYQAGLQNQTGTDNCYIGQNTGIFNTAGYNTAYGSQALIGSAGTSTGGSNTAIGALALKNTAGGASNTALGFMSGYLNTSGSGNIFIGYQAGYNETGSNKLYIANSDTTTPLIGGDFDAGSVTINSVLQLTPRADPPTPASAGMIYFDTDTHIYIYTGAIWKALDN